MSKAILENILVSTLLWLTLGVSAQMAPDFNITDSEGHPQTLYAGYLNQGKTVLIEVFFTTCPPCNAIAPYFEPLYQEWGGGDYDVEFFDLSNKNFDTNALVNAYKANYGHTYPAAGVEGGSLAAVAPYEQGMFGPFYGTPTYIVIAPDGSVQYNVHGGNNVETIAAIDAAIAATGAVKPTCLNTFALNGEFCTGDSVQVHSVWYDMPGTYTDTVPGMNGDCDSLLWITITENPLETYTLNVSFCPGDNVICFGVPYDEAGTYMVTVPGVVGCDTIVTIHVTEESYKTKTVNASFNEGDSVLIYGTWYSIPGTYSDTIAALTGCDTIATINVTEIPDVPIDISVEGLVRTFSGNPIGNAIVTARDSTGAVVKKDTTNASGQYSFTFDSVYFFTHPLSISVTKTTLPTNGVTVLDLVALQKHLLGISLLDKTENLFAADINHSAGLSVLDVLYLRKLLLGLETQLPTSDTWLFFHQSIDLGPPGFQPPIIEAPPVLLQNIRSGEQSGVFRGIKIGDLNNSANPLN